MKTTSIWGLHKILRWPQIENTKSKSTKHNIQNKTNHRYWTKHIKPNVQKQKSLYLPWTWHRSAPACFICHILKVKFQLSYFFSSGGLLNIWCDYNKFSLLLYCYILIFEKFECVTIQYCNLNFHVMTIQAM